MLFEIVEVEIIVVGEFGFLKDDEICMKWRVKRVLWRECCVGDMFIVEG